MPRSPYPRSDRDLLARIGRSAGGKAGYKQLIRELGLGGGRERRLLLEQLTRMVARGDLVRSGDQMWSLPSREPAASEARTTGRNARPAVRTLLTAVQAVEGQRRRWCSSSRFRG